jgi:DnaK suppressor protein
MEVTVDRRSEIEKLEETRQEILQKMASLKTELRSLAEPSADEADLDAYEREKTWALVQRMQHKLESVEHALQAARKGTYGICEGCGEAIDPARLEILPETTLCLDCQRKFERQNRRPRY